MADDIFADIRARFTTENFGPAKKQLDDFRNSLSTIGKVSKRIGRVSGTTGAGKGLSNVQALGTDQKVEISPATKAALQQLIEFRHAVARVNKSLGMYAINIDHLTKRQSARMRVRDRNEKIAIASEKSLGRGPSDAMLRRVGIARGRLNLAKLTTESELGKGGGILSTQKKAKEIGAVDAGRKVEGIVRKLFEAQDVSPLSSVREVGLEKEAVAFGKRKKEEEKARDKVNKSVKSGTKDINKYTAAGRSLDSVSKKITATNMSFLGVMFGVMGVINVTSRMMTSLLSPISDLDGAFESWGLSMAFGQGILDEGLFDPAEMVKGSLALKGMTSSFNAVLASFGAKVFTDEKATKGISDAIGLFSEKIMKQGTIDAIVDAVIAIADLAPVIIDLIPHLTKMLKFFTDNAVWILKLAGAAMIVLPALSVLTLAISTLSGIIQLLGVARAITMFIMFAGQTATTAGIVATSNNLMALSMTNAGAAGTAGGFGLMNFARGLAAVSLAAVGYIAVLTGIIVLLREMWVLVSRLRDLSFADLTAFRERDAVSTRSQRLGLLVGGGKEFVGSTLGPFGEGLEAEGREEVININLDLDGKVIGQFETKRTITSRLIRSGLFGDVGR